MKAHTRHLTFIIFLAIILLMLATVAVGVWVRS